MPHPEWVGKPLSNAGLEKYQDGQAQIYTVLQPNCASCALQLTNLVSLHARHPSLDIYLITERNSPALKQFLAAYTFTPQLIFDPAGSIIQALGLKSIPATLFVNAKGTIEGYYEGVLSSAELLNLGSALASGQPVPQLTVPGNPGAQPGVSWSGSPNNLLVFVQLTCPHCIDEVPELVTYAQGHPKLAVWLIALNQAKEVTAQYAKAGAPDNVQVIGSEDAALGSKLFAAYDVSGTPTQILVDSSGLIRWRNVGYAKGLGVFARIPLETTAE
jgi:hypothetical protein